MRPLIEYLENSGQRFDFMKIVSVGSDIWQMEEYRKIARVCREDALVINSYGITETTIDNAYFEMTAEDESAKALFQSGVRMPTRKCISSMTIKIVFPARVPGELYIGGNCVARGYLNLPELTEGKIYRMDSARRI